MNRIKTLLATLLLSLCINGAAWSTELPSYYPANFDSIGIIDRIDIKTATAVINDELFSISMNIKVHSLVTEHSSVHRLKKKMKIGYTSKQSSDGSEMITELWVLPNDYSPSHQ